MKVDYLIVGSGLTGATIARELFDAGREVVVVERRPHLGGNVHDFLDEHGIRIHTYGPHYFRTGSRAIWNFVTRFARFYTFRAIVKTCVDGKLYNWPLTRNWSSSPDETRSSEEAGPALTFEDACLRLMPRNIYERFIRGYTEKQWGAAAATLSPALAARLAVRGRSSPYLTKHRYQGIPINGYAEWIRCILQGITVLTDWDYLVRRHEIESRKCLVFTGSIDEYFGFDLGRLQYRSQQRVHTYIDCDGYGQSVVQINNPDPRNGLHIRTIEWKHMMPKHLAINIRGTTLTREYPTTPEHPCFYEYPFPDNRNTQLHARYSARAKCISGLLICGRLGEYRYYDMDQAIGRARMLAARLIATEEKICGFGEHKAILNDMATTHAGGTGAD